LGALQIKQLMFLGRGPFSFTIPAGNCLTISGPSGVGKTLLLRAIADLEPHEGMVLLDDRESQSMPAPCWRHQVALLPAESQWWHDTVGEHFPVFDSGLLAELGFNLDVMDWLIARLSSGEKQRLALLRLLSHQPEALLLDEPTANLDPDKGRQVEKLIHNYQKQKQAAVLWVTHNPNLPPRVADCHFNLREDGTLIQG